MRQLILSCLILTALPFGLEAQVTFGSPKEIIDNHEIDQVYIVDVDGDGDKDLIGLHYYSSALWYEQTSTPDSFALPVILNNAIGDELHFDDMDGDGDLDIITCGLWNNIAYNEGNGNFTDVQSFGGGTRSLYFDYDLDGDKDLIVYSRNPDYIYLYILERVDENGMVFAPPFTVVEQWPQDVFKHRGIHAITPIDLDGNGYKDLLIAGNLFEQPYEPQGSFSYAVMNPGTIEFSYIMPLGNFQWGGIVEKMEVVMNGALLAVLIDDYEDTDNNGYDEYDDPKFRLYNPPTFNTPPQPLNNIYQNNDFIETNSFHVSDLNADGNDDIVLSTPQVSWIEITDSNFRNP